MATSSDIEDARAHTEKAALASLNGDPELALSELILASEKCVTGLQLATTRHKRTALSELFDECAAEAERIKARRWDLQSLPVGTTYMSNGTRHVVRPPLLIVDHVLEDGRQLSKREQVLILKSSKIGDRIFAPWTEENVSKHLELIAPYCDTCDVFQPPVARMTSTARLLKCVRTPLVANDDMIIHSTLAQVAINDCALVSSLIVASQWSERFRTRLMTKAIYPRNDLGIPEINIFGKYMLKLFFNGALRQVVVDDFLPVDDAGNPRSVLAFSSNYPQVCWPAIVEKAYLKIVGTNSNGSNPASDLFLLTGWLPEQIHLGNTEIDLQALWAQLRSEWVAGRVLMNLGSPTLSPEAEKETGIVSQHSYAVTGIRKEGDNFVLSLQNPWRMGNALSSTGQTIYKSSFDVCSSDVPMFENLFLNWNTSLWKSRSAIHFSASVKQSQPSSNNIAECPQFIIANTTTEAIETSFVLSRHRGELSESSEQHGYVSLALFRSKSRIIVLRVPEAKTDYFCTIDLMLKVILAPKVLYTLAVIHRGCKVQLPRTFSLQAFHNAKGSAIDIAEAVRLTHSLVMHGAWTASTAGGPENYHTYVQNPQYLLTIEQPTDLILILECQERLDINLDVVHGHKRQVRLNPHNTVASGKEYLRQCISLTIPSLVAGSYSIIVSTFKPHEYGAFTLTIQSSHNVASVASPGLGAGKLSGRQTGSWSPAPQARQVSECNQGFTGQQAYGMCVSKCMRYSIIPIRQTTATIYLHPLNVAHVETRMSLFLGPRLVVRQAGRGSIVLEDVQLSRTGLEVSHAKKTGSLSGTGTELMMVPESQTVSYTLVCERMDSGARQVDFEVRYFSDAPLSLIQQ